MSGHHISPLNTNTESSNSDFTYKKNFPFTTSISLQIAHPRLSLTPGLFPLNPLPMTDGPRGPNSFSTVLTEGGLKVSYLKVSFFYIKDFAIFADTTSAGIFLATFSKFSMFLMPLCISPNYYLK